MIALPNRRLRSGREMEQEHDEKEAAESLAGIQGQVAIAALKGDKTLAELAQQFDIHPNQITDWKSQLLERSAAGFGDRPARENGPDLKTMQAKIGQLTLENDFLESALTKAGLLSARR